jgi:protein-L-isoaspartate(D-aspartate) O-methyltransferase
MRATPRHLFVPTDIRFRAYEDRPLPIGYGATVSQPYIVALMTEMLAPTKKHRVLEISAGPGYQAAILGQLAAEAYSVEIVPNLARSAARTLRELGYTNITVRQGDGYKGWPEQAAFDGIMVTAAPPELPQALVAQLSRGGRLVAPIGSTWNQELIVIEKKADGTITRRSMGAVRFVPMKPGGQVVRRGQAAALTPRSISCAARFADARAASCPYDIRAVNSSNRTRIWHPYCS